MFEENDIKCRWLEYLKELYDDPNRSTRSLYFEESSNGPTILKSKIQIALSGMRKLLAQTKYLLKLLKQWIISAWNFYSYLEMQFTLKEYFQMNSINQLDKSIKEIRCYQL